MKSELVQKSWWGFLDPDVQELLEESVLLLTRVARWKEHFHDYAFVVFPAAKAFEGFLKKFFFDLGFITEEEFSGKLFRIGRALNPSLEKQLRERESVYDKLVEFCNGHELPDTLWEAWKNGRNLTFHWFPNEKNAITFEEARINFLMIIDAIDKAFVSCDRTNNIKMKKPAHVNVSDMHGQ
jgi:hypothetical protein